MQVSKYQISNQITGYLSDAYQTHVPTSSKPPPYSHTLGAALCRHNVVVVDVSSELLREGDGCNSTQGGGGVPIDQVGIGWICTILNGAVVPWLI